MIEAKTIKKARFEGYVLGVLQSIEYALNKRHEPVFADELCNELLAGVSIRKLKKVCKEQDIQIDFKQLRRKK